MKGYRTGNVRAADLVDAPQYYDPECISSRFDKLYGSDGRKGGKAGLRLAVCPPHFNATFGSLVRYWP